MISVIIPSYNSAGTIRGCMNAIIRQSFRGESEIILVDSSKDDTPRIVAAEYPSVHSIHLPKQTDPGTARNIGIREAKGDVIAFIDSDCIARPDWLERIAAAHQTSKVSVIGGVVGIGNPAMDSVGWAGYLAEFREFLPKQSQKYVSHIPTCNISYKRKIFEKYGFFRGEYYPQEDLVFNYNLVKAGEKILLEPTIQVLHIHRSKLTDFLRHQEKIGAVTARVLKKIDLPGYGIVRSKALLITFIPLLPIIKFIKTVRIFSVIDTEIPNRNKVLLLFATGLVFWAKGFYLGGIDRRA